MKSRFWQMKFRYIAACLILLMAVFTFIRAKTDKIAVVKIEGVILSSEIYLEALREIERSDSFKALVVRVDSPGGSVAASQEIYSAIKRLGEKIPVIASMGNISASGGYYITCGASHIVANPGTITGSIGVIATFANYGELLRWAKIDFDVVKTGELKDAGSPLRPLASKEREYLQTMIDKALEQFQNAVATSRNITPQILKKFSDGRVVLGQSAKEAGLVDEMGTFWDAIEIAAEKAGIDKDTQVETFPKPEFSLMGLIIPEQSARLLKKHLPSSGFHSSGLYYLSEQFAPERSF